MEPLLSIVMPVFNRKDLVLIMVQSIIKQTYKNWELFLVDDGSTDGISNELKMMAKNDNRINYHLRDTGPKGAQNCRNTGYKFSKGKYVLFLDSDDIIHPECFKQRVRYMEENPELDFSVFPYIAFHKEVGDWKDGNRGAVKISTDDLEAFLYSSLPFVVWNNIYRRASLEKYKREWDLNLLSLQDADFNIQCILSGMKYDYATGVVPDYYFRSGVLEDNQRISKKICTRAHFESHLYFIEKQLCSVGENWRKKHMGAVRWSLAHKYCLGFHDYDERFVEGLNNIATKYNVGKTLKFQFVIFRILCHWLCLQPSLAKNIVFPFYCKCLRKNAKARKEKFYQLYKDVL